MYYQCILLLYIIYTLKFIIIRFREDDEDDDDDDEEDDDGVGSGGVQVIMQLVYIFIYNIYRDK